MHRADGVQYMGREGKLVLGRIFSSPHRENLAKDEPPQEIVAVAGHRPGPRIQSHFFQVAQSTGEDRWQSGEGFL